MIVGRQSPFIGDAGREMRMKCREVTDEKGPYPKSVGGTPIMWGREEAGLGMHVHKVDFAGRLQRIAYGAYADNGGGLTEVYRLHFDDGTVWELFGPAAKKS
jgi:hypothetical protein